MPCRLHPRWRLLGGRVPRGRAGELRRRQPEHRGLVRLRAQLPASRVAGRHSLHRRRRLHAGV